MIRLSQSELEVVLCKFVRGLSNALVRRMTQVSHAMTQCGCMILVNYNLTRTAYR